MRLLIVTLLLALSVAAGADVWVNGYNLNNGTYVQPHARSDPNGTTQDNYSTRGNAIPTPPSAAIGRTMAIRPTMVGRRSVLTGGRGGSPGEMGDHG